MERSNVLSQINSPFKNRIMIRLNCWWHWAEGTVSLEKYLPSKHSPTSWCSFHLVKWSGHIGYFLQYILHRVAQWDFKTLSGNEQAKCSMHKMGNWRVDVIHGCIRRNIPPCWCWHHSVDMLSYLCTLCPINNLLPDSDVFHHTTTSLQLEELFCLFIAVHQSSNLQWCRYR